MNLTSMQSTYGIIKEQIINHDPVLGSHPLVEAIDGHWVRVPLHLHLGDPAEHYAVAAIERHLARNTPDPERPVMLVGDFGASDGASVDQFVRLTVHQQPDGSLRCSALDITQNAPDDRMSNVRLEVLLAQGDGEPQVHGLKA